MALTVEQQVHELVKNSSNILITFQKNYNVDSVACALSFSRILKKLNKQFEIVCSDNDFSKNYNFLNGVSDIKHGLNSLRKFIINLDVSKIKVKEFSYDIRDNNLNIFITPENGFFAQSDVSTRSSDFKFDLIITLDTPDLESLGKIYDSDTEFFYNIPIINIDHCAQNEYYGQINMIDLTACSVSEVLYNFFNKYYEEYFDEDIYTELLAGIIYKTKSFKKDSVTPKCLNIASALIDAGADKEKIITSLYKQKTVPLLKVWGKILSNLQIEQEKKVVYSYLYRKDLEGFQVTATSIIEVIDDLIINMPDTDIVLLSYEGNDPKEIHHIVWTSGKYDALFLTKSLNSRGRQNLAYFVVYQDNIKESQKKVMEEIHKRMNT